jgi:hypothetical protein
MMMTGENLDNSTAWLDELSRLREASIDGTPEDSERFKHELQEHSSALLSLSRRAVEMRKILLEHLPEGDLFAAMGWSYGTIMTLRRLADPEGAREMDEAFDIQAGGRVP